MSAHSLDFSDFDRRARAGERLSVVFLGGSLTWGAQATDPQLTSYRALISRRLDERYPAAHFRHWDAAIGGTGSQLAAFRLDRDVLAREPDLVFLDFTINDDPYSVPDAGRLAAYESLVRRLTQAGVPVIPVVLPAKKDVERDPPARPLDARHKEIAKAYGLPVADAVTLAKARVSAGDITADLLWDLPNDATHPGDAGYALYAEAVWAAYEQAVSERRVCRIPPHMLHADAYMSVNRTRISALGALPPGWKAGKPHRSAVAFDFTMSRWLDDVTVADGERAAPLRLTVRGCHLLLFGEATPLSGQYAVSIDGGTPTIYNAGASAKTGNIRYFQMIAQELSPAQEHLIEIIPKLGTGQELRIESICIAGGPAALAPYRP